MAQSKPEATCTCPVCRDLFTEPVVIQCGHSFCESCITHWWDLSGQRSCPVCKQLFLGAQPTRNFALKDLCDTLRQERDQNQGTASEEMCSLHDEKRKLFCQVDQELICVICKDSQKHQNHKCAPVCEVAEENRTKVKVQLAELNSRLTSFKKAKVSCNSMARRIELQAQQTEKSIQQEFQELHDFLRKEEEARLDAFRTEKAQKTDEINTTLTNLNTKISSLEERVQTINQELKAKDHSFMLNLKSTLEKSQVNLPEPKSPSLALLDFGKHLKNLKFEVGEKMKNTTLETIGPQKTTRERIPVRPQPLVLGNPPFAKLLAGSLEAHRKSTSPWPRAINNI